MTHHRLNETLCVGCALSIIWAEAHSRVVSYFASSWCNWIWGGGGNVVTTILVSISSFKDCWKMAARLCLGGPKLSLIGTVVLKTLTHVDNKKIWYWYNTNEYF